MMIYSSEEAELAQTTAGALQQPQARRRSPGCVNLESDSVRLAPRTQKYLNPSQAHGQPEAAVIGRVALP
eukprot:1525530-Rhodomonas_salina.2